LTGDFHVVQAVIHNVMCRVCGTVWNDRTVSNVALERFYATYAKKTTEAGEDDLLFDASGAVETLGRNQVAFLVPHLSRLGTGRVLDVGCGKGTLLTLFAECFPGWDRAGIEPSAAAAAIARTSGLTVYEGMLDTVAIESSSFDVVTIVHVLEHAASPMAALQSIHRALRSDGLVFIEVPNMLDPNMFYDFLLHEHLFHFSPDTLCRALIRQGFAIEAVEPSTVYGATRVIARKIGDQRDVRQPPAVELSHLTSGIRAWRRLWDGMRQGAHDLAAAAAAGKRVALFGAGMTTAALLVYTELNGAPIVGLIDESPWKIGRTYFGLPVFGLADVANLDLDTIGIATIPGSQQVVRKKLSASFSANATILAVVDAAAH
jgi:2-polyprenyl-3-methyl-5-hydroxy-6-metoxy-1,4-benzoquinol methylase